MIDVIDSVGVESYIYFSGNLLKFYHETHHETLAVVLSLALLLQMLQHGDAVFMFLRCDKGVDLALEKSTVYEQSECIYAYYKRQ